MQKWLKGFATFPFPNYHPRLLHRRTVFVLEHICQTILQGVFKATLCEQSRGNERITTATCVKLATDSGLCPSPELRALLPLAAMSSQAKENGWIQGDEPLIGMYHNSQCSPDYIFRVMYWPLHLQSEDWLPSPALPVLLLMDLPQFCPFNETSLKPHKPALYTIISND